LRYGGEGGRGCNPRREGKWTPRLMGEGGRIRGGGKKGAILLAGKKSRRLGVGFVFFFFGGGLVSCWVLVGCFLYVGCVFFLGIGVCGVLFGVGRKFVVSFFGVLWVEGNLLIVFSNRGPFCWG